MLKRIADIFEKFAIASLAIGVYKEGDIKAAVAGAVFLVFCLILTKLEGKK